MSSELLSWDRGWLILEYKERVVNMQPSPGCAPSPSQWPSKHGGRTRLASGPLGDGYKYKFLTHLKPSGAQSPYPRLMPSSRGQRVLYCPHLTFVQGGFCLRTGSKEGETEPMQPQARLPRLWGVQDHEPESHGFLFLSNVIRLLPTFPRGVRDAPG